MKIEKLSDYVQSRKEFLSTGSSKIDKFMSGLRKGVVMEIAGESRTGKTQLALHFSVVAQYEK